MSQKSLNGGDPIKAKRRLTNIRAREVSLVDSPANGREFLIIKRKDAMKTKEQALFKSATATQDSPTPTQVDKPGSGDAKTTDTTAAAPVTKNFTEQAQTVLDGVPVSKALAMDSKDMFLAMSDALLCTAMTLDLIKSDLAAFVESDGKTGFGGKAVEKMAGIEEGISDDTFAKLLSIVEKKGKKMKGARLAKLKEIMSGLTTLVQELEGEEGQVTKAAAPAAADTTPKAGEEKPIAQVVEEAVSKAVEPLKARLEKVEGRPVGSSSQGADSNEDVSKSNGKSSIWKGVIGPIGKTN